MLLPSSVPQAPPPPPRPLLEVCPVTLPGPLFAAGTFPFRRLDPPPSAPVVCCVSPRARPPAPRASRAAPLSRLFDVARPPTRPPPPPCPLLEVGPAPAVLVAAGPFSVRRLGRPRPSVAPTAPSPPVFRGVSPCAPPPGGLPPTPPPPERWHE